MLIDALRRRVARLGAPPLITFYDGADGSRVELSAVTFANWVDKTANLIADLGHDDGEPIDLAIAATHPAHWVTLVWTAAAWQRGCPVEPGVTGADLLVVGPGDERRAATTVACSLHPLGLGFPQPPEGAVDYREGFAQPDVHDPSPLGESTLWAGSPVAPVPASDDRVLLVDPDAAQALSAGLLAPVAGAGSTVIAIGVAPERATSIAAEERARRL